MPAKMAGNLQLNNNYKWQGNFQVNFLCFCETEKRGIFMPLFLVGFDKWRTTALPNNLRGGYASTYRLFA